MKKVIIGGILTFIGSLNTLTVHIVAAINMTSSWTTPPGRFVTTLYELGMIPLLGFGYVSLILGLAIMGIEYLKK